MQAKKPSTRAELQTLWHAIVSDFHSNDHWGYKGDGMKTPKNKGDEATREMVAFLRTALVPTLVTKSFILFFGIMYTLYPGEGYGWGLLVSCLFTLATFCYFIWSQSGKEEI